MSIVISTLTPADADAVDELMKDNSQTLGFLPRQAIDSFLRDDGTERVLGATTPDGQLLGYMIYAAYPDRFRIAHLCVSRHFRGHGIARRFIETLKQNATTQKDMRLHCRRDYPANAMWPKLGFVPLGERPGRSAAGHILTFWRRPLAEDDQLDLFRVNTSDDTLDVVIDAQILFDFHEPGNNTTVPSKALLADFLADSLNLLITDEMYVEINRKDNAAQRRLSRQRAQGFPTARHDLKFAGHLTDALSAVLPRNTPSQESDIQQLAKTAAADVKFFVTRDNGLLKKSAAILDLTGVQVVRPTELIVRLHELSDRQSYVPRRVAGHGLEWRRLTSSDLAAFPLAAFRAGAEREGVLRDRLGTFLAEPARFSVDVLWLADQAVTIRILAERPGGIVAVPYCRVARAVDWLLFSRFLVADTIASAVAHCRNLVVFENTGAPRDLVPHLLDMNFVDHNGAFLRYCFSSPLNREEALSQIVALLPGCEEDFRRLSTLELEECCSPCSIEDADQDYFLVPIRPSYAMSLFDVDRSADDLFGGRTTVLLRWENAYYRAKTQHRMLKPPARILWYVTHSVRKIVAVSRLKSVEIGRPKVLLKKFKKFGILEWSDLFEMCHRDPTREIMAFVFSHTFSFREPVPLKTLRAIFKEDGVGLVLQSAQRVPANSFRKIFLQGFPNQT